MGLLQDPCGVAAFGSVPELVAVVFLTRDRLAVDETANPILPDFKLNFRVSGKIPHPMLEDNGERESGRYENREPKKGSEESHLGKKDLNAGC